MNDSVQIVLISVGVTVAINALILAAALGRLFGTVQGHHTQIADHERRLRAATMHLISVASTCAAYFSNNPNSIASQAMEDTVKQLREENDQ